MFIKNKYPVFITTGMIASGKSTFSKLLTERLNALYISADIIAHDILKEKMDVIVSKFGSQILDIDNNIDRKKLGAIVFADGQKLFELEQVIHPAVNAHIDNIILAADKPIVYEVALLEKSNYKNIENPTIIYVGSSNENMISRMLGRGLDKDEAQQRIKSQIDIAKLKENKDIIVIENNTTLENLKENINKLLMVHLKTISDNNSND